MDLSLIMIQIYKIEYQVCYFIEDEKYEEGITLSNQSQELIHQNIKYIPFYVIATNIINRAALFLIKNDFRKVEGELRKFDMYMVGRRVNDNLLFRRFIFECELYLRIGDISKEHYNRIIYVVNKALDIFEGNKERCELFLYKGKAELAMNKNRFQITSFSEALALAEKSCDEQLIAKAYMDLSLMFDIRYNGLCLYFLRKAEVIFEQLKDAKGLNNEYMRRAMCNMVVYDRLIRNEYTERFKKEAQRLVKKVDVSLLKNESDKWYFQRIKACVYSDETLLDGVIEYYHKIRSQKETHRTIEIYIHICLNKGLLHKVESILPLYKDISRDNMDALQHIAIIEEGIKRKNEGEIIEYHFPFDRAHCETNLLDILDDIAIFEEYVALDNSPMSLLIPSCREEGKFDAITMLDGNVYLFPCNPTVSHYYRGQNKYFKECKASIHRQGLTEADIFVERLKYAELKLLIQSHPIHKIYKEGVAVKQPDGTAQPVCLNVDYLALAQHYGIKTELLDLTADKFVAAFFACTDYNSETDSYSVHKGNEGHGVFYKYIYVPEPFQSPTRTQNPLRVVGLQPFSRPGEQAGCAVQMQEGANFNEICSQAISFRHDENIARLIFNYTNRQKRLFPGDILDSKIPAIKKGNKFSRQALELAIGEFYQLADKDAIERYIKGKGITICEYPIVNFTHEEIDKFNKDWKEGDEQRFFDKVIVRPVYKPER